MNNTQPYGMDHFEPAEGDQRVSPSGGPLPLGNTPEDRIAQVQTTDELDRLRSQLGDMMMTESIERALRNKARELESKNQAA